MKKSAIFSDFSTTDPLDVSRITTTEHESSTENFPAPWKLDFIEILTLHILKHHVLREIEPQKNPLFPIQTHFFQFGFQYWNGGSKSEWSNHLHLNQQIKNPPEINTVS